jgi:hypothetical protein
MLERARQVAIATAVAAIATGVSISQATPTARGAGNSITATATLDTSYDPYNPTAAIRGRIMAGGHKYGPRHCLSDRDVWAYYTDVGGQPHSIDADRPTDKKGRFTFTQIPVKYGDASINGTVPPSGGTVTYTVSPSAAHAPKRRGDILDRYRCRSVSTTVEVQVPPAPPS